MACAILCPFCGNGYGATVGSEMDGGDEMKAYKTIERDNGTITIYGPNRWQNLYWATPEWKDVKGDDEHMEQYFVHRGRRCYLSEFMSVRKDAPDWMQEFDGYTNDSFFSGLVLKFAQGEDYYDKEDKVKVFIYIS